MRNIFFTLLLFVLSAPAKSSATCVRPLYLVSDLSTAIDTFPVIICPADTVLAAPPTACAVDVNFDITVSDDQPGWTLTQIGGLPSGAAFPVGATVNQFMVTDADGNTAACSFSVTVKDTLPPVALCKTDVTVDLGPDDPNDCFDGPVVWVHASVFDAGSYDACSDVHMTIRRSPIYSHCINSLNPVNGQPDCHDPFYDFPCEFERAVNEYDSLKVYCCEWGFSPQQFGLELRAYQLNPDGSFAIGADNKPIFSKCSPIVTVNTTACPLPVPHLNGLIDLDGNHDCEVDNTQFDIPSMNVRAITPHGDTLFTASDPTGYFSFGDVDTGAYIVELFPQSPIWVLCGNPDTLTVEAGTFFQKWWSAQLETQCPVIYTDIATSVMRPCSTATWVVRNCNIGGVAAEDAFVQVTLDEQLTLISASEPYTLNGDTMIVPLGDIASGACHDISIVLEVPCDPAIAGQHLCVEAHIFPDTLCLPPTPLWSGAQIEASAICDGDSVHFILRNAGDAPTAGALKYIVIDDMVIMRQGELPGGFAPGAEQLETMHANGQTLRIKSQQETNHPAAQMPSLAIENCNGVTIPSELLAFTNEDGNPFTELACRPVTTSYDPNEKLAFPSGYSDEHFIDQNIPLSYQLNFQNTGNDTAFLVVLRDTLSPLLDPATIRVGAGSHPYTWTLEGPGYLTVRFANILLPDSTTNEPASHGFIKFNIDQKTDNPLGSVIENRAGIYFDINPVVMTNTVFHTVGKDFLTTAADEPETTGNLKVYPNPASESMYVPLESDAQVRLLDMFNRTIRVWQGKAPGLTIRRDGLPAGIYLLEASPAKGKMQAGKVVWQSKQ